MEKLDVVNAALAALRAGETCELVVVAGTAGSSPRGVGAWMAVFADGSQAGTIGGGCSESAVMRQAYYLIGTGEHKCVTIDMSNDIAAQEGMVCGGQMKVLLVDLGTKKIDIK